ncbi:MAG TPA: magnesium/cobalt transporter CorA [Solirubrobacterales bacterium]|nr:magnesium/cobalt transporter CorA [Solirubrobacterales bacterium]
MPLEAAAARTGGESPDDFVWVGLHDPTAEEMEEVAARFGLHELAVEDAERAHQRPKVEDYGDSLFLVIKTARYDEQSETVHFGEIDVFLGAGYVVHVRHGDASGLRGARRRLQEREDLLRQGPGAVVWAILDQVVDDYMPVVQGIDDDVEEVEAQVFDPESPAPTARIYFLKREVIEFHRAVWPLLAPLESIERGAFPGIEEQLQRFLRDVSDHARRVDEAVTSQRELLTSVLEANLALVSVNQNEVVKKISAYAALIGVPTFIASVYGMNFEHMPELRSEIGYPAALAAMAVAVVILYALLRRARWL